MPQKPSTVEHFEVSYTDLCGDRRIQNAPTEPEATAHAARFAEEGMAAIDIQKVATTSTGVPFKAPNPAVEDPGE